MINDPRAAQGEQDASHDEGRGPRDDGDQIVAVNVGNTFVSAGTVDTQTLTVSSGGYSVAVESLHTDAEYAAAAAEIAALAGLCGARAVLIASVNRGVSDALEAALTAALPDPPLDVPRDVPVPMNHALTDEAIAGTGVDRLLNTLAAHERYNLACAVVDTGSAITVDFVDGVGTFQGGAIACGAQMALRALHEKTDALPDLHLRAPDDAAFAPNTEQAMLQGVLYGARGLVRTLVERYAEAFGTWPKVVATGGDAMLLFEGDDVVESIEPDLTFRGIAVCWRDAVAHEDGADETGSAGGPAEGPGRAGGA